MKVHEVQVHSEYVDYKNYMYLLACLIFRFEKAIIANAKQNVTLDVLSYHASASWEDAQRLRVGIYYFTFITCY